MERNVCSLSELDDAPGVFFGKRQRNISGNGSDCQHLDLVRGAERHQDGNRVILARITIRE